MVKSESLEMTKESIGYLAVQVLSAKYDLSTMSYEEMLKELCTIVSDLQEKADDTLPRSALD